jgi:hypothetical protein
VGAAEARRRVGVLLDVMDLAGAGRTLVVDYSAGMRKEVGLACALVHAPLGVPVVAVVPVALASRPEASWWGQILGPALAATVGLTMVDEFAYDGTAAWVGIAAGPRGRADRAGRHAVVLAVAGPVTIGGSLVGTALADRWEAAPAAVGPSVTVLLVGLGVAAVASVVWSYPVPEPGANPFSSTSGGSVTAVIQQGAATLATTLLVSPVLAAAILALWWPAVGWAVLAVGPAWGALCLSAGVRRGAPARPARSRATRGPAHLTGRGRRPAGRERRRAG